MDELRRVATPHTAMGSLEDEHRIGEDDTGLDRQTGRGERLCTYPLSIPWSRSRDRFSGLRVTCL